MIKGTKRKMHRPSPARAVLRAWELPWVEGADVGDDGDYALDVAAADAVELVPEVEADQLLLRGVEAEPGGQLLGHGGARGRSDRRFALARWSRRRGVAWG